MAAAFGLSGCGERQEPRRTELPVVSGPLSHSAYIWQRDWNEAVRTAVVEHGAAFGELSVLGAQIMWRNGSAAPEVVRPGVNWKALASTGRPVSAAIRIERTGSESETVEAIQKEAGRLEKAAGEAGLKLCGIQIDYDSAQSKLGGYTSWLRKAVEALKPQPVRITVLASWLGEAEFKTLINVCDGYVLQVHSFDRPPPGRRPAVCDPVKAKAWVQQAAALGHPFTVALPTYRTTAGYDAAGKLTGIAMDSVSPRWTAETRLEEFPADPDELSALVAEWTKARPAALTGIWWYRFPVSTDARNWRWSTLAAVMNGRAPVSKLAVKTTGGQPVDLVLWNDGEKDEWLPEKITARWEESVEALGDGVSGWEFATQENEATFSATVPLRKKLLPVGQSIALGWLRFREPAPANVPMSIEIAPSVTGSAPR
ncbi:MAG TPA: DUF3142 domain-containing protein [Verrucomicrobiales bacterium]|nr:DUF3142 domain-containing protein [Verrucomicrobiales bacterium]